MLFFKFFTFLPPCLLYYNTALKKSSHIRQPLLSLLTLLKNQIKNHVVKFDN